MRGVARRAPRPSDQVSQVRLAHRLVGKHLRRRARRDQRAEVEHEHALDEVPHELDVVLDEQDRESLFACTSAQPSRRVPRSRARSRPDDGSSSSTSAVWVISARPISTRRPTPRLSDSTLRSATGVRPSRSSIASARSCSSRCRPAEEQHVLPERALAVAHALGDQEVFARRHAREELDALERARDAEPGPLVASARCVRSRPSNVTVPRRASGCRAGS